MTAQTPDGITVWKWEEAPEKYRGLSPYNGGEQEVAEIAANVPSWVYGLWLQNNFKYISRTFMKHPDDNSLIIIGSRTKRIDITG